MEFMEFMGFMERVSLWSCGAYGVWRDHGVACGAYGLME